MKKLLKITVSCAVAMVCTSAIADDKSLKQCLAIKSKLARLESLRAGGGSARKMDNWKRQIHAQQDEYSRLYCRQYRFELDKR